jgi:hypothetical protein
MKSSRAAVAIACLAFAAAVLSGTATGAIVVPLTPVGAARQTAASQHFERRPKCVKAARNRASFRTLEAVERTGTQRRCRRRGAKRPAAVPQAAESIADLPLPISAPKWNQSVSGHSNSPAAAPAPPSGQKPLVSPPVVPGEAFRFFSPQSFWNAPLAEDAALDPNSTAITAAFETTIARAFQTGNGPWINTTDYSVPIYTVAADQPTVSVRLASPFSAPALQSAWEEVPMPDQARPSDGSDRTLVIWQPSSDRIWEFWRLTEASGGWKAVWGGAIQSASSSQGVYGPEAWPGARSWWGSSASSLSIAGGLITLEDLQHGRIDHALALAIPNVRADFYSSPAQRSDGTSSDPLSLPEGAHLRLDPSLDLAALHLPHLTLMVAEAAQRYGIFIRDRSKVTHFFAQDPTPTGTNPYAGPTGYFEGRSPAQLLAQFPWARLQLLAMDLHRSD